jgi:hypothetical protein
VLQYSLNNIYLHVMLRYFFQYNTCTSFKIVVHLMSYSFNYCASGVFVHISFANDSNDDSNYERVGKKFYHKNPYALHHIYL